MYNDTKTPADRVKHRTITERPQNEKRPSKTLLIILTAVVVIMYLLASRHDFAMLQAGLI